MQDSEGFSYASRATLSCNSKINTHSLNQQYKVQYVYSSTQLEDSKQRAIAKEAKQEWINHLKVHGITYLQQPLKSFVCQKVGQVSTGIFYSTLQLLSLMHEKNLQSTLKQYIINTNCSCAQYKMFACKPNYNWIQNIQIITLMYSMNLCEWSKKQITDTSSCDKNCFFFREWKPFPGYWLWKTENRVLRNKPYVHNTSLISAHT